MMRGLADLGLLNGPATGLLSFGCLFGAGLAGMAAARVPANRSTVGAMAETLRRGTMLVAVLAALMLVFVTNALKSSFDAAEQDVRRFSSQLVEVDRALRHAGPGGDAARELLFRYTARVMRDIWPSTRAGPRMEGVSANALLDRLEAEIMVMRAAHPLPSEDARAALRSSLESRFDLDARVGGSLSPWLAGFLQFWLMLTFASLGIATPRTPLAITALALFAVAFGGAMFLATEYDYPFDGVISISTEPVENALFVMTE